MDDLTQKITSILNDPESFETIRSIADSLMGDGDGDNRTQKTAQSSPDLSQLFNSVTPEQMGGIMRVMSALNSRSSDDRAALLLALKPHLSQKRRDRVDKAVKLLKLAAVMPLVTESGIFNL